MSMNKVLVFTKYVKQGTGRRFTVEISAEHFTLKLNKEQGAEQLFVYQEFGGEGRFIELDIEKIYQIQDTNSFSRIIINNGENYEELPVDTTDEQIFELIKREEN